jgi:hypothetical protein
LENVKKYWPPSHVSGRPGVWFSSDSGLPIGAAGLSKDQRRIWIKVEEIE